MVHNRRAKWHTVLLQPGHTRGKCPTSNVKLPLVLGLSILGHTQGVSMATRREVAQLEGRMSPDDYRKLQSLFVDCYGASRSLSRAEFVSGALALVCRGSAEDYGFLFDSVLLSRERRGLLLDVEAVKEEGVLDWSGLCSFLLLQLSEKVKRSQRSNVPCWKPPRTLASPHRDPIQKVLYVQSWGQYMSVSRRGTAGVWEAEDVSLLHTLPLHNSTVRAKDLWVTDLVLLHNLDKVVVSFTSKELCFYDIGSKPDFNCKYKIQGLKFTPWCLDYWADPSLPDQAVLSVGDIGGQVSALCFTSVQISLFESRWARAADGADLILWDELLRGRHRCCYIVSHQAHQPAWVRRVCYVGPLGAFLSCSTSPSSSLVVAWKNDSRSLRLTTCYTKRGVWDLDHHQQLKLIATAGVDHQVRLWNPYMTSKPVGVLSGHEGPVTTVCFMQNKQQLLSFSKDKVLCLWDISSQQCLHRLTEVFPKTSEDTRALLFLHEEKQLLLLSFHNQLVLLQADTEDRRTSSHQSPVTCVLYNSLFRQVVSGDSASRVICWLPDTGQRVTQFHRCHGNAPITTMALDGTQTRLFTAGADGEVKVWDLNGCCLHRMNAGQGRHVHINQVLPLRRSVLVVGWQRMPSVFRLHSFTKAVVEPSEWRGGVHQCGEVVCAAFQTPETLVTAGSIDGEIIVWNNSTEKVLRKLQMNTEPNEDNNNNTGSTCLLFIPERENTSATGGADLVACGGSGTVRFWNTVHSCVLGQFTAHNSDLGSIVMTVSPCGTYLVTADKEGTVKTWDIQNYCRSATESVTSELPELIHTSRPHLDRVTHLEACFHGDRLLLLSASLDSSVALSYLPGELIGYFGQEESWSLERTGLEYSQGGPEWDKVNHSGAEERAEKEESAPGRAEH
ncbi:cilia- and flagella-associated protein 337-like [Eucyclogobius newberryi]|uniref:cilia- and flagella-associated protein 337-like n=1 Tax=Eucyclogobius newberryi TaxID=166745 RepID=UPI003B5C492D